MANFSCESYCDVLCLSSSRKVLPLCLRCLDNLIYPPAEPRKKNEDRFRRKLEVLPKKPRGFCLAHHEIGLCGKVSDDLILSLLSRRESEGGQSSCAEEIWFLATESTHNGAGLIARSKPGGCLGTLFACLKIVS